MFFLSIFYLFVYLGIDTYLLFTMVLALRGSFYIVFLSWYWGGVNIGLLCRFRLASEVICSLSTRFCSSQIQFTLPSIQTFYLYNLRRTHPDISTNHLHPITPITLNPSNPPATPTPATTMPPRKAAAASTTTKPTTDDAKACTLILTYLISQNRPYSATEISSNLHNAVTKARTDKLLKEMFERGEIAGKASGKQWVFWGVQVCFSCGVSGMGRGVRRRGLDEG
ncbi:hypothetical protein VC83_04699 [Pseudogymnoascus destructans]|uniref:Homologous-pairing protein 2 winged helix domain-containing protein n=1 Tax=Pseudogymnoascus destructans TaxID=655981 RepID=A0A177A8J4_9PEZI|nr:uncharacterized protein VC83_04699 [Pseudogymnoascus destructans]OAF57354.1 hypothetical protein VC83_04699 [Pseudogymnoascus destructans]